MVVSFNHFDKLDTPDLVLCNPACVYSGGDTTNAIGTIHDPSDFECIYNFNAMSELNFRVYHIESGNTVNDTYTQFIYDSIRTKRYIYIPSIGYFCITSSDETLADEKKYKDVQAYSAEKELENRNIPYIADGTYELRHAGGTGILDILLAGVPYWSIGEIDDELDDIARTFEDVDVNSNIYSFLTNNIQDAFECIVLFDILNREINIYKKSNYVVETDIHLTQKDWINSVVIKEDSDNIYTALRVSGGNDLGISTVNPLRSNVVYNFSNYTSWMSSDLATKVAAWQELVGSASVSYYSNALTYWNMYDDKVDVELEIERLNIVLSLYQSCKSNIQQTQTIGSIPEYNSMIVANGGTAITIEATIQDTLDDIDTLISQTQSSIASEQSNLNDIESDMQPYAAAMDSIYNSVSFTSYFTQAERNELSFYIFEGSYEYEYITTNDTMSELDKTRQARKLYATANYTLSSAAVSAITFDLDAESFIFIKRFADWSQQLETGCLVSIEVRPEDVIQVFLLSIVVNYETKKAELKFGSKLDRKDPKTLFDNVLDNIKKSANSIVI